jgi:hypothetical protein
MHATAHTLEYTCVQHLWPSLLLSVHTGRESVCVTSLPSSTSNLVPNHSHPSPGYPHDQSYDGAHDLSPDQSHDGAHDLSLDHSHDQSPPPDHS